MAALEKHLKMMHQQRIAAAANIKAEQNKRIKLEQKESASSAQQSESGKGFLYNVSMNGPALTMLILLYLLLFPIDCQ